MFTAVVPAMLVVVAMVIAVIIAFGRRDHATPHPTDEGQQNSTARDFA